MAKPCFISQIKDFPFTQDEIADIWKLAKGKYIDTGHTFDETIDGMAADLGMNKLHIVQAFTAPKTLRVVGNAMWNKLQDRRAAIEKAKMVVRDINRSGLAKKIDKLYNFPRSALTFGHGGVFPVTHMGTLAFSRHIGTFLNTTAQAWSFAGKGGKARYEIAIQNHLADPDYTIARRASKSVDPGQQTVGILHGMTGWSGRGFNTLKIARLELFKKEWRKLAPEDQTLDAAKSIMNVVDSATGEVSLGSAGKWLAKGLFAPKLLPARFKMAFVDPYRAINTAVHWKNATAGERLAAKFVMKNTAGVIGFYTAALALNQGINFAVGSEDEVNFTDPSKGDWLSFKIAGYNIRPPNAIIEVVRLMGGMIAAFATSEKQSRGKHPEQLALEKLADYARYKLHPSVRLVSEVASGKDLFGRPVPFPGIKELVTGDELKVKKSKPPIDPVEYILGKGPIPVGGAAREFYTLLREEGLDHTDTKAWLRSAVVFGVEAGGIQIHEAHDSAEEKSNAQPAAPMAFIR